MSKPTIYKHCPTCGDSQYVALGLTKVKLKDCQCPRLEDLPPVGAGVKREDFVVVEPEWPLDTVFVDYSIYPYRGMMMCHMVSKDLDALHTMAYRIGIKRAWFQEHPQMPHYDICKSKRKLAVKYGAVEVERYEMMLVKQYLTKQQQKL